MHNIVAIVSLLQCRGVCDSRGKIGPSRSNQGGSLLTGSFGDVHSLLGDGVAWGSSVSTVKVLSLPHNPGSCNIP